MTIFHAVVLGIIQGLTEFLPISSSGHLIVVPWLLNWKEHTLTFDVMLHGGTLVAILVYFWKDWMQLLGGSLKDIRSGNYWKGRDSRLVTLIVVSSIPAALIGLKFDDVIEGIFRTKYLGIAGVMIIMGVILLVADIIGSKRRLEEQVGVGDATGIGLAQAMALFPGVSRSGATITAGLFAGLTRKAAARFSFLMATPIIFGASAYKMAKMAVAVMHHKPLEDPVSVLVVGFVTSAVVGYAAIAGLLAYLRQHSMLPFTLYRLAFGILIIATFVIRR